MATQQPLPQQTPARISPPERRVRFHAEEGLGERTTAGKLRPISNKIEKANRHIKKSVKEKEEHFSNIQQLTSEQVNQQAGFCEATEHYKAFLIEKLVIGSTDRYKTYLQDLDFKELLEEVEDRYNTCSDEKKQAISFVYQLLCCPNPILGDGLKLDRAMSLGLL